MSDFEKQVGYHKRRIEELKQVRQPWEATWQGLSDFIEPTRYRPTQRNERGASREKIIDSTGTFALRTLASGMHSGITSPARPWFRLTTYDPELKDFAPVKYYLAEVEQRMREVFQSSNIYNAFHIGYGDLGQFGQSLGVLFETDQNILQMQQLVHGQFWLARDGEGRTTTMYRTFRWSVQRIVERFVYKGDRRAVPDWERVSPKIKTAWDTSKYNEAYDIWHAIEPRLNRDHTNPNKANMPFLSNYWEDGGDRMLEESGFSENPLIGPAWELSGDDHYALSPGQVALGDVKMLQKEQTRKLEAIDKMVRPPMTGPTSMKNNPASLIPGSVTYVDDPTGKGYRPAMEVNVNLSYMSNDIREVQTKIERAFYADLFLMLTNMEGIQPRNQFEIAERKEEKLLALGPVLENIYAGQLEPVIDRAFAVLSRRGELPEPPAELRGKTIKPEYISILAQAQKAVATGAIERGVAFAGQLAAVKPDVMDKIDVDEAVDVYFDYIGVPPSIVVPDDKVRETRDARARKQQAAEQAAMAAEIAPAAKAGADAAAVLADAGNNPSGSALLSQIGLT